MDILSVHDSKHYIKKAVAVSIDPALAARAETEDRAVTTAVSGALALSVQGLRNYQNLPMAQPAIAASPDDLVLAADDQFAIFDKGGNNHFQSSLLDWFAAVLPSSSWSVSEPQLLYDVASKRYVLAASAFSSRDRLSRLLLSVPSRFPVIDSPGMGIWNSFSLDAKLNHTTPTENWVDAIRIGMNDNTVLVTGNMFSFSDNSFQYSKLWAIPKAQLYSFSSGSPLTSGFTDWNFKNTDGSVASSLVPAQSYISGTIAYIVDIHLLLLKDEPSGILNWFIEGATKLLQDIKACGDIALSAEQKKRVEDLLDESDSLTLFLKESVQTASNTDDLSTDELITAYAKYCIERKWDMIPASAAERRLPDKMSLLFRLRKCHDIQRDGKNRNGDHGVTLRPPCGLPLAPHLKTHPAQLSAQGRRPAPTGATKLLSPLLC
jgi:hypothetical protein